jgi:hypothetical protein
VKYDHLGNLIGSTKFDNGFDDYATAITVNRLGEFYISGYSATGTLASDDYDFVVFRFNGQDLQAPSPFRATAHNTTVELNWTENDADIDGYKLYRKNGGCAVGSTSFSLANLIHTAASGDTAYTNSGLNIGSTYCYGVQTYRLATSEVSRIIEREVTTTTPVPPSNLVATLKNTSEVEVCWHDNSASEDGFAVQRCTGVDCDFSQVTTLFAPAEVNPAATATCLVDTAACEGGGGKSFRYRVQAYKVNAWSSGFAGATETVTTPGLVAPSGLSASKVTEASAVLQWTDNTVDESDFAIERCQGSGCSNFMEIGAISAVQGNALLLEMDETVWTGAAGQVLDYSGKGRNATAVGGPVTVADSHQGRAATLDGVNDYLTTPLVIDQSGQSAGATMMAWVKPAATTGGQHFLFSTEDGTTTQIRNSWGLLREGGLWQVATGEAVRSTGVTVTPGQWQHLAVVFTPGSGVKFYKNGVATTINAVGLHATSAALTVGRQGVLNQGFFDGLVDEAAVFSRALTAAEVQTVHGRGVFPESTGQKWFTDTTVTVNTDYQYRVKARKQTGCGTDISDPSPAIALHTTPPPPQPLAATLIKAGMVTLNWTPQTQTHSGFQVERCNGAGCTDFTILTSTSGGSVHKYTDTTACFGTDGVNRYRVKALGAWGASEPSPVAEAASVAGQSPAALVVTRATEGSVALSWTYGGSYNDGFSVARCPGNQTACAQSNAFTAISASPISGLDPALQGLWHLDDPSWTGAAGEVVDSSGLGHHGTPVGGVVLESPGNSGYGAAAFDGVNAAIDTNLAIDQSTSSPGATFMAWVYLPDLIYRYQQLFSTDNGGYDWGLRIYGNTWYIDTGATTYYVGYNGTFKTWQHIAVVFDPYAGVRLYVNGALLGSVANLEFDASSGPFTIGRHAVEGNFFAGKMDEVLVLNRPLTTPEVAAYFNRTTPITAVDATGLDLGTDYTYRVTPLVNSTCGDWDANAVSAQVTATTPAVAMAPDTLTVTQNGSTALDLTWHTNTGSESGFVVERCQGASCDFSVKESFLTGPGVTSYHDTSVCQGQSYRYQVQAVKGSAAPWQWATAFTAPVAKSTAAASPVAFNLTVVNEAEIGITWNDANPDEDAYELSRCQVVTGETACDQPAQFTVLETYPGTVAGALLNYRLEEASWSGLSNEVVDSSGTSRHGIGYGGATTVAGGRFGRAGAFNGATSYVQVPLTLDQSRGSTGVTMEAWVYPTMTDSSPRSVLSTENGGNDWGIVVQDGKWYVNTGLSQYDTGLTVDVNAWQHVTAVFTPMVGIQFYKNNEVSSAIAEIDYDFSTYALNIGRNASTTSSSNHFQGRIDEVLVYGRPLTATEVAAHNTYQENSAYSYSDKGLQHSTTYFYRVTARKAAGCGWEQATTHSAATMAPPAPTNLTVAGPDSTSCALQWRDNNGSESGYMVSRCEGTSGDCPTPVLTNLAANSTTFSDDTLCPQQTYTYQVWAVGAWGQTAAVSLGLTTTAQTTTPTNLMVNATSEVKTDITWNYDSAGHDESGVTLSRCLGATCVDLNLPPGTTSYADSELEPNLQYCYRVSVYKTASCGWQTAATGPVCATTTPAAGGLIATPTNTTTVALAWDDRAQTETAAVIERCAGDLATCCNSNPASCLGPFSPVGLAGMNQQTFADSAVCAGNAYTYRVNTKGEGLTLANNGCWMRRAPLTFTTFPAFAGVEVIIPYQTGMKADFSDIRFYDATAHRELQYWIRQKTNSTSATVWLMTGANPAIYLYYGNAAATSGAASDALFTETYDDFQGTAINAGKWVELDTASNKITQNNGLQFAYRDSNQDAAVISTKTFERAAGNELYVDFTVGADVQGFRDETFFLGWEQDQTSQATWSGNAAHLLHLTSNGNHYIQYAYEDAATLYLAKVLYNDQTRYQMKIVLNGGAGAKYYLRGGLFTDWRLLTESTTARPDDDLLRIGFHQASHNITIHQVTVKHASAQRGVAVNFAAGEGDGVTCLTFSHTWVGSPTAAAQAATAAVVPPTALTADVVNGGVQLTWNPGTGDESEFRVERNCGSGFTQVGVVPAGVTTYMDQTMPASAQCSYQVKGHKETPCPWTSPPTPATQLLTPPAAPVLNATAENAFKVRLDWSDATDEEGYDLEAKVFNGAWMPVISLPANQVSYTDGHGVNPGSMYTYRLRARRANGSSAWGEESVTTPAYTPGAVTCPTP